MIKFVGYLKKVAAFLRRLMLRLFSEACDITWTATKVSLGFTLGFTLGIGIIISFIREIVPVAFAFSEILVVFLKFLFWLFRVTV